MIRNQKNRFASMRYLVNYILLVGSLFVLNSCSNQKKEAEGKTVFRYTASSSITSLDPAFAKDQDNIWGCIQLYNGLVQLDDELRVQPCIAKSWEILDSSTTYIFHLRNDVFFHTDTLLPKNEIHPVKASDFVYSFNRLIDPKVASPGSWVMNNVKRTEQGLLMIYAIDDTTLIIHLEKPFSPFPGLLTMPYCSVVPKNAVDFYGSDFRNHPVGSGPFKFSMWKEGVKLIFLKNEHYFERDSVEKKLPYLDAVEISFISDKQSAFIEFLKGNLDFISGIYASYKDDLLTRHGNLQSKYAHRFKMETQPYLNTEYLGILSDRSATNPLQNKLVRQALNYGFDRRKMMKYLLNNIGTAATSGFIPPGLPSFDSTLVNGYDYNPSMARELLKEAGYPDGKGLPEINMSTTITYQELTEYIKSQWEEIGFKIKIDVNQAAFHRKMVAEQKLPFFRGSWIADYPDAENYLALFYSKNFAPAGPNFTHFSNAAFDALYEKASVESTDSIRFGYYRQMDQIVMNEAPVVVLYYDKVLRLTQNNIEGLGSNAMNLLVLKKVRKKE